ncbi:MAG: M48 family metalloprotease [Vulcanimicrobiota bacterium]
MCDPIRSIQGNWFVPNAPASAQAPAQEAPKPAKSEAYAGGVESPGLSAPEEKEIGERHEQDLAEKYGEWEDEAAQARLERLAERLLPLVTRDDVDYAFALLDTELAFASACPNGTVFFTRGLLATLVEDRHLCFFAAHELTHTERRHYATRQARFEEVRRQVGFTRSPEERQMLEFAALAATRHQEEYEADAGAVEMLARLELGAEVGTEALALLEEAYRHVSPKALSHNPLDLSSHPPFQERVARLGQAPPDPLTLVHQLRRHFA